MSELFSDFAGRSEAYFSVQGVEFMAAPFTLQEFVEYQQLPSDGRHVGERADFMASRLRRRIRGTTTDPATITTEWLMEHLGLPRLGYLETLLLTGKKPEDGGKGK
ncbi:hypothetical protein GCM10008955_01240 [Deinococcus malanensis]|uniref:Uncharacterized protein n=1 Tax=Deinococcus malanensis TaxID=1706855 RepID=A0ABQ2EJV8_9DEIO|nr:hypothetical protein [Deinococcus malanensis]GGK11761.1 hypothetical protein GCM10008955_01240 [Deinococcus malanensis]